MHNSFKNTLFLQENMHCDRNDSPFFYAFADFLSKSLVFKLAVIVIMHITNRNFHFISLPARATCFLIMYMVEYMR